MKKISLLKSKHQHLLNELENKNIKMNITFASMFSFTSCVLSSLYLFFLKEAFLHFSILCSSTWSFLCVLMQLWEIQEMSEKVSIIRCLISLNYRN